MRGRAVVGGSDGFIRAAHFEPALAQPVKSLRGGDFVHQMQVNVKHCRRAGLLGNDMPLPDFVKKRFSCHAQYTQPLG